MAEPNYYSPTQTRPHWGGSKSDIDQHLELYTYEVDTRFRRESIFRGMTPTRSISGTNNIRIDRMNTAKVMGRRSGEKVESQPVRTDKLQIYVDTMAYIRNDIDYNDDWTGPDYIGELTTSNGNEFARLYDNAHMTQLIKARDWTPPAHLRPAFNDGIEIKITLKADATSEEDMEANAVILNLAHLSGINELVKRFAPIDNLVTLVDTEVYSTILQHPKLMSTRYGESNADGFKQRRVFIMNGIRIIEFQDFPKEDDVGGTHPLGASYVPTAEDVKCRMVTFDQRLALQTVEAQAFTTRLWDDRREMTWVLDCYTMYNVGVRRPDVIAVTNITYTKGE